MTDSRNLVIWLCSSNDEYYQDWIRNLAEKANAPVFSPHITLMGSIHTDDVISYRNAIFPIVNNIRKINIDFKEIQMEEIIWRAMYFLVEPKGELTKIHHKLVNALHKIGAKKESHYLPHLSLLYAEFSKEEKQNLLENTQAIFPSRNLLFDQIKIVDFNSNDVEASEELFCFELK